MPQPIPIPYPGLLLKSSPREPLKFSGQKVPLKTGKLAQDICVVVEHVVSTQFEN